jgi:hypothetical protein
MLGAYPGSVLIIPRCQANSMETNPFSGKLSSDKRLACSVSLVGRK